MPKIIQICPVESEGVREWFGLADDGNVYVESRGNWFTDPYIESLEEAFFEQRSEYWRTERKKYRSKIEELEKQIEDLKEAQSNA